MKVLVVMMVLQEQLDRYVWTDICDLHALPCGTAAPVTCPVLPAVAERERATGVPFRNGSAFIFWERKEKEGDRRGTEQSKSARLLRAVLALSRVA